MTASKKKEHKQLQVSKCGSNPLPFNRIPITFRNHVVHYRVKASQRKSSSTDKPKQTELEHCETNQKSGGQEDSLLVLSRLLVEVDSECLHRDD